MYIFFIGRNWKYASFFLTILYMHRALVMKLKPPIIGGWFFSFTTACVRVLYNSTMCIKSKTENPYWGRGGGENLRRLGKERRIFRCFTRACLSISISSRWFFFFFLL